MDIWTELGINKTKDKVKIKEAYVNKLPDANPEDNPEEFKKLKTAYDAALEYCKKTDDSEENLSPIEKWMKKVKDVYFTFSKKINEDEWRNLLKDDCCYSLDSKEDAFISLFRFFMDYTFIPQNIWKILDSVFDIQNRKTELYEDFPPNFIDYVINRINNKDLLDYSLFKGDDKCDYEECIRTYFKLNNEIYGDNKQDIEDDIKKLYNFSIYHPYFDVLKVKYYLRLNKIKEARDLASKLMSSYENDIQVVHSMAEVEWEDKNMDKALAMYKKMLEIDKNSFDAKSGVADCLLNIGSIDEARDMYIDLNNINPYDTYIRNKIYECDLKLIDIDKKKLEEKPGDIDILFSLSWSYYKVFKYEDSLKTAESFIPEEKDKEEYYNLLAKDYSRLNDHKKSISFYKKWLEVINTKINSDDSEKDDQINERLPYAYLGIGDELFAIKEYDKSLEYLDKALEFDKDNIDFLDKKASLLNATHKYNESVVICDRILSIDDTYVNGYLNRAEAYFYLENDNDCINDCDEALNNFRFLTKAYLLKMKVFYKYDYFDNMLKVAEQCQEYDIMNIDLYVYKSKALRGQRKYKEALEVTDAILNELKEREKNGISADDIINAEAYFEIAQVLADNNQYETALKYANEIVELDHKNIEYKYFKCYVLRELDDSDSALRIYKKILKEYPDEEFAQRNIAEIYTENRDFEKALKMYRKILKDNPDNRYANNAMGEIYRKLHRNEMAIKYFTNQLKVNPSDYYYINRGIAYDDSNELDKAVDDYNEAIKLNDKNIYAYNNLGYVYQQKNQYEKAVEYYKKSILYSGNEEFVNPYNNIGLCFKFLKQYDESLKYYDMAIEKMPDEERVYYNKGKLLKLMKKSDEAIESYKKGLEKKDADKKDYYDEIAKVYSLKEDYKNAILWEKKVLKIDKSTIYALENIGNFYKKSKSYFNALYYYYLQSRVNPANNPDALRNIASVFKKMKIEFLSRNFYKKALNVYLKFYDSASDARHVVNIARCYNELGIKDKAIEYVNKALSMDRCSFCDFSMCHDAYDILGQVYEKSKEYDKSLKCFEKALQIDESEDEYREDVERLKKLVRVKKEEID